MGRALSLAALVVMGTLLLDGCGGDSTATVAAVNDPLPTLASITAAPNPVFPSSRQIVTASAFGAHDEPVTYSWSVAGGWTIVSGQATASVTLQAPATYSVSGSATVTVTNPSGGSVTGQLGLGTSGDPLPILSSIAASSSPVSKGGPLTLTATALGYPGDTLSYGWMAPAGWTITSGQGTSQLQVTAPNAYSQMGSFTLVVANGNGGSVNGEITVDTASDPVPTLTGIKPSGNPIGKAATFTLTASASGAPGDMLGYVWGAPTGWTVDSGQGTAVLTVTAPGLYSASGVFTVAVSNGNGGSVNGQVTVTTSSDPPPSLSSITASSNPVMQGATFTVVATASGLPGDTLSYAWTVPTGWTIAGGQGTTNLSVTAPNTYQTSGSITLTVANGNGGSVNGEITISTTTDPLPTITSVTPTPNPAPVGTNQTITAVASSPSGDVLTYTWSVPTGWSIVSGQGSSTLTVTAPQLYGVSEDVTLTVSNPSGGAVNAVVPVSTGSDVVASLEIVPTAQAGYLVPSGNPGFTLYGDREQLFRAIAYDANHIQILGAGAPTIAVTGSPGLTLTPQPASPDLWGITNTDFNTPQSVTLTATPATGPTIIAQVPVQPRHIAFYAAFKLQPGIVAVYNDEGANPVQTLQLVINFPTGLAIGDDGTMVIPSVGATQVISNTQQLVIGIGDSTNNVCIDHLGNIYLTDSNGNGGNGQVEEYAANGVLITTYTSGMDMPLDCSIDVDNGLYVANNGNASIVHFPFGSTIPDDSWGVSGGVTVEAVAVDHVGTVYVGLNDTTFVPRVQVYPRGSHIPAFTLNTYTTAPFLDEPTGLSVDVAGNLWVSSFCAGSCGAVQVFQAPLTSASVPTNLPYAVSGVLPPLIGGVVFPHQ